MGDIERKKEKKKKETPSALIIDTFAFICHRQMAIFLVLNEPFILKVIKIFNKCTLLPLKEEPSKFQGQN